MKGHIFTSALNHLCQPQPTLFVHAHYGCCCTCLSLCQRSALSVCAHPHLSTSALFLCACHCCLCVPTFVLVALIVMPSWAIPLLLLLLTLVVCVCIKYRVSTLRNSPLFHILPTWIRTIDQLLICRTITHIILKQDRSWSERGELDGKRQKCTHG